MTNVGINAFNEFRHPGFSVGVLDGVVLWGNGVQGFRAGSLERILRGGRNGTPQGNRYRIRLVYLTHCFY